MPHLDPVTLALWILTNSAQAAALGAMVYAQSWRRWPSLFAFIVIMNVQAVALIGSVAAGSNFAYFWSYYVTAIMAQAAEFFVIMEICRCLVRGTAWLERFVAWAVPIGSGAVMLITALLALTDHTPSYYKIVSVMRHWDVAVSLGWLLVFLGVFFGSRCVGIQWSHGARGIGVGFLLEIISSTLDSLSVMCLRPSVAIYVVRGLMYLATLTIWSAAILSEKRTGSLSLYPPSSDRRVYLQKGLLGQ